MRFDMIVLRSISLRPTTSPATSRSSRVARCSTADASRRQNLPISHVTVSDTSWALPPGKYL